MKTKKKLKSVRLDDEICKKIAEISEIQDWKDAHTLLRLIECGLKYWDVRSIRRLN